MVDTRNRRRERVMSSPNSAVFDQPGGRQQLLTPCLIVDIAQLDANIARMQRLADQAGVRLRPHGKAHKCAAIASRQIEAGAVGICSATPGEAEAFFRAGIRNILLTSTFSTRQAAQRVVTLAGDGAELTIVLDNVETARLVAGIAARKGVLLDVLIDVDMGRHRSGVASAEEALALAHVIAACSALTLNGIQAYAGHLSHCIAFEERKQRADEVAAIIARTLAALKPFFAEAPPIVTGGSTGAFPIELVMDLYTELQCGSYALMDVEYDAVDPDGSGQPMFAPSLFVATSVTSANHRGVATTDGGEKRFVAKHGTPPRITKGAPDGATYKATSDEHGTITLADPDAALPVGSMVEVEVPHCDPTVNLYDFIHVVRGDTVVDIWPVDGRGA